jgi:hypothetical protein
MAESKTTPGKIPVAAAKKVAEQYGLKQCLLIGYDGEQVHVVTYGKTKADCAAAAKAQDFWTGKIREFSFKGTRYECENCSDMGCDKCQ